MLSIANVKTLQNKQKLGRSHFQKDSQLQLPSQCSCSSSHSQTLPPRYSTGVNLCLHALRDAKSLSVFPTHPGHTGRITTSPPHRPFPDHKKTRSLPEELLQRSLHLDIILAQLDQLHPDRLEAILVARVLEPRLVLAVTQMLDLLAAVAHVHESQRRAGALEEMPKRGEGF
jgi:hypothetical protein